jgi:hypothetical protein
MHVLEGGDGLYSEAVLVFLVGVRKRSGALVLEGTWARGWAWRSPNHRKGVAPQAGLPLKPLAFVI